MQHPFLIADTVYLRALERGDLSGRMFQWANDPEVTQYMYMGTFPNNMDKLEREYSSLVANTPAGLVQLPGNPSHVVFAIIDKKDDLHIGNVGI